MFCLLLRPVRTTFDLSFSAIPRRLPRKPVPPVTRIVDPIRIYFPPIKKQRQLPSAQTSNSVNARDRLRTRRYRSARWIDAARSNLLIAGQQNTSTHVSESRP